METTRPRVDSPDQARPSVHFTASYLLNPTNPLTVNLIGAGGTGSQVLTLLARMNHAFTELGHPGLQVRLWDGDTVSQANLGRQLFAHSELKLNKAVALINRVNGFFGTNWKAVPTPLLYQPPSGKFAPARIGQSVHYVRRYRIGTAGNRADITGTKGTGQT